MPSWWSKINFKLHGRRAQFHAAIYLIQTDLVAGPSESSFTFHNVTCDIEMSASRLKKSSSDGLLLNSYPSRIAFLLLFNSFRREIWLITFWFIWTSPSPRPWLNFLPSNLNSWTIISVKSELFYYSDASSTSSAGRMLSFLFNGFPLACQTRINCCLCTLTQARLYITTIQPSSSIELFR